MSASVIIKIYFLYLLIQYGIKPDGIKKTLLFLIGTLAGSLVTDFAWLVKLWHILFDPQGTYFFVSFSIRLAWGFLIIQYQSLSLFLESLITKNSTLHWLQKILLCFSNIVACYFFFIAICGDVLTKETENQITLLSFNALPLEFKMMRFVVFYLLYLIILPTLILTFIRMRSPQVPKILKTQIRVFVFYLIMPYLSSEVLQCIYFIFPRIHAVIFPIVCFSTILLTYAIYYCIKKVMFLRFLNVREKVNAQPRATFVEEFRTILDLLSHATDIHELHHITQLFFKEAFNIPITETHIYISPDAFEHGYPPQETQAIVSHIEHYFNYENPSFSMYLKHHKILVYDDLCFSSYYQKQPDNMQALSFLYNIHADIFLPIYIQEKKIAYIIITRHERDQAYFTSTDQDEMLLFANYLGNMIRLLQHRRIEHLIKREKYLQEELSLKNREIKQYRESIRSFLQRDTSSSMIGIICYKNHRFVYANQVSRELIKISLNQHQGHQITRACKTIVEHVEQYKAPYSLKVKNDIKEELIISGVPHLEQNIVILTISYPNVTDIISQHINQLKNPTKWDYLLYLETTQSGKLINELIPGSGEHLINFKIELLSAALSDKAILIDNAPERDLENIVEILHHLSLRKSIKIISLTEHEKQYTWAIILFGMNPIFDKKEQDPPLLSLLHEIGTLFIKNIHFLSMETQEHLAEFLQYGYFRSFRSDQKFQAYVRIICSSNENLAHLAEQGKFSYKLLNMIQKTTLRIPSPKQLTQQELSELVDAFSNQMETTAYNKRILLNTKDKDKLSQQAFVSLHDLKKRVQHLVSIKSKKSTLYNEIPFDREYSSTDHELINIAQLGKKALKDQSIMVFLWNVFKKQHKIAQFLGVNRSSVNRRCKQYNIK